MRIKPLLSFALSISLIIVPVINKDKMKPPNSKYVFIPQGSMNLDGMTYTLDAFWIAPFEVSNKEYSFFLADLKAQGRDEDYEIARVKNENWKVLGMDFYDKYSEHYHSHTAFEDYPVVNISYEGAQIYCDWLNENSDDNKDYRLPTRVEWIYAARGGLDLSVYPWGGTKLTNKKGEPLCNYRQIGDENIGYSDSLGTYSVVESTYIGIPTLANMYNPNEYGLYNVSGNIAEMVTEKGMVMGGSWDSPGYDVRVTSSAIYNTPDPRVGFRPVRNYVGKE